MQYKKFLEEGFLIGSGAMEAAHKTYYSIGLSFLGKDGQWLDYNR